MSFEITITGTDTLAFATTAEPETHGDRLAAKAAFDDAIIAAIQSAIDEIAGVEGATQINARGVAGDGRVVALTPTPPKEKVPRKAETDTAKAGATS